MPLGGIALYYVQTLAAVFELLLLGSSSFFLTNALLQLLLALKHVLL